MLLSIFRRGNGISKTCTHEGRGKSSSSYYFARGTCYILQRHAEQIGKRGFLVFRVILDNKVIYWCGEIL